MALRRRLAPVAASEAMAPAAAAVSGLAAPVAAMEATAHVAEATSAAPVAAAGARSSAATNFLNFLTRNSVRVCDGSETPPGARGCVGGKSACGCLRSNGARGQGSVGCACGRRGSAKFSNHNLPQPLAAQLNEGLHKRVPDPSDLRPRDRIAISAKVAEGHGERPQGSTWARQAYPRHPLQFHHVLDSRWICASRLFV